MSAEGPSPASGWQRICASGDIEERGPGLRFEIQRGNESLPAFAIRYAGRVHAYVNRCAHAGIELDWNEGEFFDPAGQMLVCATHGALYEPENGHCFAGPCKGRRLVALVTRESEGAVWVALQPVARA
jgi:nitrite reductase/ring-hydroxylating ferredoxin subunit